MCKYVGNKGEGWIVALCHGKKDKPLLLEEVTRTETISLYHPKRVIYIDIYIEDKPTIVSDGTIDYWTESHCIDKLFSIHCPLTIYTPHLIRNIYNILMRGGYFYLVWKPSFFPSDHIQYKSSERAIIDMHAHMQSIYQVIISNGFEYNRLLKIQLFEKARPQIFIEFVRI